MIESLWVAIGFLAQLVFTGRFVVQWIASERRRESTVPVAFWYLSLAGGMMLLAYAVWRRDPVFMLGQSVGLVVYVRNLMLLGRRRATGRVSDLALPPPAAGFLRGAAAWLPLLAVGVVLAFAFQGSRGLTEPDEGRYSEVAREMLVTGDVLSPQLDFKPHFTKPPLTYWCIAASMRLFGPGEWSVRLFLSLAYLGTVLLVARTAADLWGRRTGIAAGIIYATSLTPFVGASIVTPDTLLVLWLALAVWAFFRGARARSAAARRSWPLVTGVAFGLAFLTKGPPALLFLPAMLLARRFFWRRSDGAAPVLNVGGVAAFLILGAGWYVLVASHHDGLLGYWWRDEILGRLAGQHHRNPEWYGPLVIYGPVLTLGALPWSLLWPRLWRRLSGPIRALGWRRALQRRPEAASLALLVVVPLVVLSLARSRLPLYVLPLFIPLALGTARAAVHLFEERQASPVRRHVWGIRLASWCVLLMVARLGYAWHPGSRDARHLMASLPASRDAEIVVADGHEHYGLGFYSGRDLVYAIPSLDAPCADAIREAPAPGEQTLDRRDVGAALGGPTLEEEVCEHRQPGCHPHLFLVAPAVAPGLLSRLDAVDATVLETRELQGLVAVLTAGTTGATTTGGASRPRREDRVPDGVAAPATRRDGRALRRGT
ncbi:MAG: lipid-A-disaccharide synthase N-terminal domain-containing protein [Candidatus Eiseniibacteriota bacterium]|jgi:4-amino-4-deoxy-L-arabinose transferase